jgi:hypothetical protein
MNLLVAFILTQTMNLNPSGTTPPDRGAFGAALTVQEHVPLSLSFPYNLLDPVVVVTATDAGTVTADGGHVILTVGTTGYAELRSRLAARYVPGQGLATRFTFVSDKACHSGQELVIGAGDDTDQFSFGCCPTCGTDGGASFGALRRSNGVDDWTPVARFNGAWGRVAPDITKGRPYQIAWQWLGYGQITYSIEDATTGAFKTAHAIRYAGTAIDTSISNATLPLHAHVITSGSDAGLVVRVPSMAIIRQGEEPTSGVRNQANASTSLVAATEVQVLAIRSQPTFNTKTNRTPVQVDWLSWSLGTSAGVSDAVIRLRLNPSQTGAAYRSISTFSSVNFNFDGGIADAGVDLMSLVASEGLSGVVDLRPYEIHLAPEDILLVTGTAAAGTPDLRVSLSWVEER